MKVADYTTKSLDHLGLVSVLCKELGVAEFIDERIPKQTIQSHISHGELLVAMILNGLGFVSRTLHMVPDYFAEKPVERLIGPGIKAEHINDDAMGRADRRGGRNLGRRADAGSAGPVQSDLVQRSDFPTS